MYEFNYYDYKKAFSFNAQVNIDNSGIKIKSDATDTVLDSATGNISEINTNEKVDENVNLIFMEDVYRYMVQPVGEKPLDDIIYKKGEQITTGEDELILLEDLYYGETNNDAPILLKDGIDNITGEYKVYNIPIIPKHKLLMEPDSERSVQVDREIYAVLGLWDNNDYNITLKSGNNTLGKSDDKSSCYLSKKEYNSRIKTLTDLLGPKEIGINVTRYERKAEIITDPKTGKTKETGIDINASELKRKNKFSTTKTKAPTFISKKQLTDELLDVPVNDITPFSMSIEDVFKSSFDSPEELVARLGDVINYLFEKINDLPNSRNYFASIIKEIENNIVINTRYEKDEKGNNIKDVNGNDIPVFLTDPTKDDAYITNDGKEYIEPKKNANGNYVDIDGNISEIPIINVKNDKYVDNRLTETDIELKDDASLAKIVKSIKKWTTKSIRQLKADKDSSIMGFSISFALNRKLARVEDAITKLTEIVKKIYWYERYTAEPVLSNKQFVTEPDITLREDFSRKLARILIPVDMGTKSRGMFKKRRDYGIRWFEISFVDTSVLSEYRKINTPSGVKTQISIPVTSATIDESTNDIKLITKIPHNFDETLIGITVIGATDRRFNGTYPAYIIYEEISISSIIGNGSEVTVITTNAHNLNLGDKITISGTNLFDNPKIVITSVINNETFTYDANITGTLNIGTIITSNIERTSVYYSLNDGRNLTQPPLGDLYIISTITEYETSKQNENPEPITISFKMPNLPSDDILRKKGFTFYGQFGQEQNSNRIEEDKPIKVMDSWGRNYESNTIPNGFKIFLESSKNIEALRKGIDIYNKVQFLIHILQSEFNESRVKLIETTRSLADQNILQLGGEESNFLSWHNYGLAVKILITEKDGLNLIQRRSDDFYKLMNIAKIFIQGAKEGRFGTPMNVVWCEQLVIGSDMFVWEFLPLGVGHRDSWKFRMSAYNQQDPVLTHGYVNVTEKGYDISENDPIPNSPYIFKSSAAYQNALVINGNRYVHPSNINGYIIPNDLILKDIQEFLYLVENKFKAHGIELLSDTTVEEWKSQNPISFNQLVIYNCLIGNFSVVRSLLASDFIDTFKIEIASVSKNNPVTFVKTILGDEYENVKIKLDNNNDGSYISLANGKIITPVADMRSTHPAGSGNLYGEKQITPDSIEYGNYENGKFISESDTPLYTTTSDNPVIDGYDIDGTPVRGDAIFLHVLIKGIILIEIERIKELFNGLKTKFLYDDLENSPNQDSMDLLENEFGVIKAQTLAEDKVINGEDVLPIVKIESMYKKMDINDKAKISSIDGRLQGIGADLGRDNENLDIDTNANTNPNANRNQNQSVYEKLISTAQVSGMQLARLTKEKPIIEELKTIDTIEKTVKFVKNNKISVPEIKDIL